jgi:hypothetical protein
MEELGFRLAATPCVMIRRGASVRAVRLDEVCKQSSVGGKEEEV